MGTKMAIAFVNISLSKVGTEILIKSTFHPLVLKRYGRNIFNLDKNRIEIHSEFIEQANNHNPTIKFATE